MITDEMNELWDYMVEGEIATDEEIGLATALCGQSLETLERVLYIKTGYRSLEQIREEEEGEEYDLTDLSEYGESLVDYTSTYIM